MALDLIEKMNSVLLMDMVEIAKIFGADMSSSSYANNKKNNILVLGKGFV